MNQKHVNQLNQKHQTMNINYIDWKSIYIYIYIYKWIENKSKKKKKSQFFQVKYISRYQMNINWIYKIRAMHILFYLQFTHSTLTANHEKKKRYIVHAWISLVFIASFELSSDFSMEKFRLENTLDTDTDTFRAEQYETFTIMLDSTLTIYIKIYIKTIPSSANLWSPYQLHNVVNQSRDQRARKFSISHICCIYTFIHSNIV